MSVTVRAIKTVIFSVASTASRHWGAEQETYEDGVCPRGGTLGKYAADRSTGDKLRVGNFFDFERVKSGVARYKWGSRNKNKKKIYKKTCMQENQTRSNLALRLPVPVPVYTYGQEEIEI